MSIIPFMALPVVLHSVIIGQNGVLSAALIGFGTILLDRGRPFVAGLVLGCLIYKPHLGLLVPVVLLAGRHGRAFAGAAASVVVLSAASAAIFGPGVFAAYAETFLHAGAGVYGSSDSAATTMGSGVRPAWLLNIYGAALQMGAPTAVALAAQLLATLATAVAVAMIWRWSDNGMAPKAVALVAGNAVGGADRALLRLRYDRGCFGVVVASGTGDRLASPGRRRSI